MRHPPLLQTHPPHELISRKSICTRLVQESENRETINLRERHQATTLVDEFRLRIAHALQMDFACMRFARTTGLLTNPTGLKASTEVGPRSASGPDPLPVDHPSAGDRLEPEACGPSCNRQ